MKTKFKVGDLVTLKKSGDRLFAEVKHGDICTIEKASDGIIWYRVKGQDKPFAWAGLPKHFEKITKAKRRKRVSR